MTKAAKMLSIVVPVYNERSAVKGFIDELNEACEGLGMQTECILVDDCSDDGTSDILRTCRMKVVRHNANLGYGASLKTGINEAQGDMVCIIDCDGTYSPHDIKNLAPLISRFDMVVGARVRSGRSLFPLYQRAAKHLVHMMLRCASRQKVLDINSGFRIMRKDVAKKYYPILPNGFSFTSTITFAMLLDNHTIHYVPIDYRERRGRSKINTCRYTAQFIMSFWKTLRYLRFGARKKMVHEDQR